MNLLLDTCTFIWLCAEPKKLSAKAKSHLRDAVELGISDVSVMEISLKWQAGKIRLPQPPSYWIEEQSEMHQLRRWPLTRDVICRASELAAFHKDPFDRLLVAQAQTFKLTIVTPDQYIKAYPVSYIW
ncbi:MAG: type II toxin-antitoxin system VapC family toxin [Kiritimatiellia bacterium]